MRFLLLILSLLVIIIPRQVEYPPELPPIPSEEMVFKALGFEVVEDEPIEHTEGDVVTADILVVLSSGVTPSVCQQGIDRINVTASNSGVATAQTRLIGCLPTTYISSNNCNTDLTRLRVPNDGFMDEALVMRESVFADTLVLVGKTNVCCGYAWLNSSAGNAFAYVHDGCISNSSFEHEWGHNVGMAHDLPNAGTLAYPYGVGWCVLAGLFRTVEVYPSPCGGNRIPHYSNPDILYQGRPTGTATANNARVLRDRIAVVAGFRINPNASPTTNHLRED